MIKNISLILMPSQAANDAVIKKQLASELGLSAKRIRGYTIEKQSLDARSRQPKVILQLTVFVDEPVKEEPAFDPELRNVTNAKPVIIIGAGPAGLFAALRLISLGFKPIIIERGKDVRSRRRDLAAMN